MSTWCRPAQPRSFIPRAAFSLTLPDVPDATGRVIPTVTFEQTTPHVIWDDRICLLQIPLPTGLLLYFRRKKPFSVHFCFLVLRTSVLHFWPFPHSTTTTQQLGGGGGGGSRKPGPEGRKACHLAGKQGLGHIYARRGRGCASLCLRCWRRDAELTGSVGPMSP